MRGEGRLPGTAMIGVGRYRDALALQALVQRRPGQIRDRRLKGMEAVVQRQTLLRKSPDGRGSPFPRQTYLTASVMGMPSAVNPFSTATRTWNSAT